MPRRAGFVGRGPNGAFETSVREFSFYRLKPVSIRFVARFGQEEWMRVDECRPAHASRTDIGAAVMGPAGVRRAMALVLDEVRDHG